MIVYPVLVVVYVWISVPVTYNVYHDMMVLSDPDRKKVISFVQVMLSPLAG